MRPRIHQADRPPAMLAASFELWRDARREFSKVQGWPGGIVEMLQQGYQERRRVFSQK
jgi:hypothetical protein